MPLKIRCFPVFPAAVIGSRLQSFQPLGIDRKSRQKTVAQSPSVIE
jgi:hypothetical protein